MPCFGYDRHEINFLLLILPFNFTFQLSTMLQLFISNTFKGTEYSKNENWYFLCSVCPFKVSFIDLLFIISIFNQLLFLDIDVKIVGPDQKDIHRVWIFVTQKTCLAYILEHLYNRPHPSPTLPRILNIGLLGTLSRYIFKLKIFLCLAVVTL